MITVTEATFARRVLRAELPVLVCFGARACPGRQALRPALERLSAAYDGRLLVAMALLDRAPLLAEQYGLAVSPTLAVFRDGDQQGQAPGFLSPGLLDLLAQDILEGALTGGRLWSPVEARFEEAALIPLFEGWGLSVERQAACPLPGKNRAQRGRVDLLVYEHPDRPPLTLVESKRQIQSEEELLQAARQAAGYARSLAPPSFIVAAPRGLWVYQNVGERSRCVRRVTSLELHQAPELLLQLLLGLR
jgi:thiol-disulfide isomerase/thioredoxin